MSNKNCVSLFSSSVQINKTIEELIAKFCRLEECYTQNKYALEENMCRSYFKNTTTRGPVVDLLYNYHLKTPLLAYAFLIPQHYAVYLH